MADCIEQMVLRAKEAQQTIEYWDQEQIDEIVLAAGWEVYRKENAEVCARLAFDETGMGVYEDKLLKLQKKTLGTLRDLHGVKTVGVIEENREKGLVKLAKPVGVIGALTPVTNAAATLPGNALSALKTRNAIIFAPHPSAKKTAAKVCDFMRAGLRKAGAPEDLIQCISEPSIELSQALMKQVDLVLATGGSAMVRAAYSSGTPAYGVGAGNVVVIVDETADLAAAARKIRLGKTFDFATSCSSENSVLIQDSKFEEMIGCLQQEGGYLCSLEEKAQLRKAMWPDGKHLSKAIIAQSAQTIAKAAGLTVPDETRFIMVPGEAVGPDDPFSGEKLSVVLTVWRYGEFDEAVDYVNRITAYSGKGHSCGIHTQRDDRILELATRARVSRIMVNQSQSYGNSGNYDNGMPFTLTLGCGTWGGNISSENITWKHFINTTWVSKPIEPVVPDENVIFGSHWEKYGR